MDTTNLNLDSANAQEEVTAGKGHKGRKAAAKGAAVVGAAGLGVAATLGTQALAGDTTPEEGLAQAVPAGNPSDAVNPEEPAIASLEAAEDFDVNEIPVNPEEIEAVGTGNPSSDMLAMNEPKPISSFDDPAMELDIDVTPDIAENPEIEIPPMNYEGEADGEYLANGEIGTSDDICVPDTDINDILV